MAKAGALTVTLCILAFATIAQCEIFDVKGHIFCDPCKLGFQHEKAYGLKGATVELTCSSIANGTVTFSQKAETDAGGDYLISLKGDHEDDLCEVKAISSGDEDCKVVIGGSARIECTEKSGMTSDIRLANALGFSREFAIPGCKQVVEGMDLDEAEKKDLLMSAEELRELL